MAQIKVQFNRGVEGATNIVDAGTEGTKVGSGTTAQRGSTTGQWRYNTTTGFFEGRNESGNFSTLEPTPTVSSVDVTEVDPTAGGTQTFVITGTNFTSGGTISFIGTDSTETNATTTTINSGTQVTAVANKSIFTNANEPYKIKFTSTSNLSGQTGSGLIYSDQDPSWTTTAGNIGNFLEGSTANLSVSATDPDGDTVSYAISSGSLPTGLSLNTVNGAITGTLPTVSADTTSTFDIRATANSKTSDRTFNIVVKNLNENVLLYDGTNTTPANNNPSDGNASINTNVNLSNIGNGSSGTMRSAFANATVLTAHSELYGHYNTSNTISLSSTIWSMVGDNSGHTGAYNHFGSYSNGGFPNSNIWFTLDFGGQPSFKIRRWTGYGVWGTGSSTWTIWGTNDSSLLPGNSRGSFGGNSMTKITENTLSSGSGNYDSGVFSNANYHRYISIEMHSSGSPYDWGWNSTKFYGDYY